MYARAITLHQYRRLIARQLCYILSLFITGFKIRIMNGTHLKTVLKGLGEVIGII